MTIGELGEFNFIHRIAPLFRPQKNLNVEGIGNDCAVIPFHDNLSYLVTTDLLVEQTHFIKSLITPEDLGYKSLAVNLSDIAAMGGTPQYAFLSLGLSTDTPIAWLDGFFVGFKQLADESNVLLLGGDTSKSEQMVINVLVLGMIENRCIKRRSHASPGDILCCTGTLGDSGGGLKILLGNLAQDSFTQGLIDAHVRPRPHLEEGKWLAMQEGTHAMMDISDGLASDIQRIAEESHCGAHIEVELLPISSELRHASGKFGWQAENLALTAGEDYCLLVTMDPKLYPTISEKYKHQFQRPLYRIGTIEASPSIRYTYHQQDYSIMGNGYDHFLI